MLLSYETVVKNSWINSTKHTQTLIVFYTVRESEITQNSALTLSQLVSWILVELRIRKYLSEKSLEKLTLDRRNPKDLLQTIR